MRMRIGILMALALSGAALFTLGGCASDKPMPGASAGSFMDDSYLTTAVKSKLLANEGLKSFDIKVITDHQVVTLKGTLPTEALRQQAISVAKSVGGVKDVVSELEVKSN
ncbi:MAG TPA: BON domain-containing protein [Gammaproteobacteria bacterium]|nr:BON domain-containing protein [Gammaproteobacteria bacterium]HEV2332278.1 BON domain-containing protein [Gammaproteobacteria bacterium]